MARTPPPSYEAFTEGVCVRVKPKFMHDESSPARHKFIWAYTVEIENESPRTLTLTHRHWQIIDAMGRKQNVDGAGVVGQTPTLAPGESFTYTSGCPLSTPSGLMRGTYDFVDEDGFPLAAQVPLFSLDSPYEKSRPS